MADEFHTGICSTMSLWSNESINWTQPFLPVEFNQIQTGFGDSSLNQIKEMNDQAMLAGLFEPVDPLKDMNIDSVQPSWAKFSPQFSRVSSPSKQQLNFSNNTPFWNPSANSAPVKILETKLEDESSCSNLMTMKLSETKKHGSDQPASKKPRIATPSPLPTFKVRKEKLGDRITALQQLVSPFGKTDTASVLQEAIDYVKFLHGQVGALTTPYLKNGHEMQHQKSLESSKDDGLQDLRSRGLCLVPISSTFAVASETPMEFWAPTFLGSYR